ncbi:unnamed protein product [Symbiodinium pilosum]|uniref:Uncharacterized protein n=1 Tax=Symbiodinium pilosum TaxID=2952 RepID=A0A812SJN7_SYMPI|nr:unnamed protein product [Symbiodinium pilosum]
MKAIWLALCLPSVLVTAAKLPRRASPKLQHDLVKEAAALARLSAKRAHKSHKAAVSCPDNQFPAVNVTVEGVGYLKDILAADVLEQLQTNLASHPDWKIGKPWTLSMVADSIERREDRKFGFAGGEGFHVFTVKKEQVGQRITITDKVKTLPGSTRLEYRGHDPITLEGAIHLTNICLRPMTCDTFFDQQKTACLNDDVWKRRENPEEVTGHTRNMCCERMKCIEEAPCSPATMYEKRSDYDTAFGSKPEQCCTPKPCSKDLCTSSLWEPKPGNVFGSTKEECCLPRDCDDYKCTAKYVKKPKRHGQDGSPLLLQGNSDSECCEPISCKHIDCEATDEWKTNQSASLGASLEDCCIPQFCKQHSCSPATKWEPNPKAILGSSNPSCCTPKMCKDFECEAGFQLRAGAVIGGRGLMGSTSNECCEKKSCHDWKCSDPTKWVQQADESSRGVQRKGWSDEECCTPLMCSAIDCVPESLWAPKSAEELDGLQGSSSKQCCNPRWCKDYTCTGDDPERNVTSTTWYKKVDTNHFKFQGSTDEECCHPKYCSEYTTKFPTKYRRKSETQEKPRLGTSEAECYDELKCSDYCCKEKALQLKEDAAQLLGSTDKECCEKPS